MLPRTGAHGVATAPPMDERSLPISEVLAELEAARAADFSYEGQGILGSMISGPHPLAAEVYARCLETNVGDPGLFPGVARIEREVVAMLGALLANPAARGNLVSGGNEANILALWAAREGHSRPGPMRVIVPETAHVSYEKAARLLGLELVHVPVDARHRVDVDAVADAIDARTIALVGVAGSTDIGAVDPIPELAALALERGLHLHVDAAFGGFVLPFLEACGRPAPRFDFGVEGVASITIDPHKMGFGIQPAGAILFRDFSLSDEVRTDIAYLAGGKSHQTTLTGTRPGAAACATWAVMKHLGRRGYAAIVARCMERTDRLVARVHELDGVHVATEPELNIVGLVPERLEVSTLARRLRGRGWALGAFRRHLRAVLLPHVTEEHLDAFLPVLASELRTVAAEEPSTAGA